MIFTLPLCEALANFCQLDIQIPDPEIEPAPSSRGPGESGTALPLEPAPVMIA